MLKKEVIDAVNNGKFNIYAVKNIDEGIELLTGLEAGTKTDENKYPENTMNYLVEKQLESMAVRLKEFYKEEKPEKQREREA